MDLSEVFDKFCTLIKREMTDISYKTWIHDNTRLVAINGETAYFEYIDQLHKNMLNRYQILITKYINLVVGKKLNVVFVSKEEAMNNHKVMNLREEWRARRIKSIFYE